MNLKPYFNQDIKPKIIEELNNANSEIIAAIAWFNDKDIYDILKSKVEQGVVIQLMISNDTNNFNSVDSLDFDELIESGVVVNRLLTEDKLMHHKFCVIDNHTLITGSFNWTYGASSNNLENIIIAENDIKACEKFKAEFERMVDTYFKYLDEAVEILENMKSKVSDLQDQIIKHRYLPDRIMQNLKSYGTGNFLKETPNSNENVEIIEGDKGLWWESLSENVQKVLNDKILKAGKIISMPASDALVYIYNLDELKLEGVNFRGKWNKERQVYDHVYNLEGLEGLGTFPKLKKLNVSNNYFLDNHISGLEKLKTLTELNISHNEISHMPLVDYMKNLTHLDISFNTFTSMDFISNFPNLIVLKCNGNKIRGIDGIEKAKKIRFLFLDLDTFELSFVKSRLIELGYALRDNGEESLVKLERVVENGN